MFSSYPSILEDSISSVFKTLADSGIFLSIQPVVLLIKSFSGLGGSTYSLCRGCLHYRLKLLITRLVPA